MSVASARRTVVPVGDSGTIRNTVAYVIREAVDEAGADDRGDGGSKAHAQRERELHFVFPVAWQNRDLNAEEAGEAEDLLERVRAWIREDLELADDEEIPISVTTAVIGTDEYLFSPRDYAETILEYARENDVGHVVLDPEYRPGSQATLLEPVATELDFAEGVTYEEAPVDRSVRGRRLLGRTANVGAVATVFGLCFLFYQIIGGFAGTFDYVTGAVSAGIAAAVFSGITFDRGVSPARALAPAARWLLYIPYLFWQVAKANVEVAYIVLHPSMPIDPSVVRFRPAVPLGLPVTSLANSITLTPGTVTIDVRDRQFHVHALTRSAREDLLGGSLERAIRFAFFGRSAARIPSPRDRAGSEPDGAEDPGPDTQDGGGDGS